MNKESRQDFTEDFRKEAEELLEFQEENLSDFALFLSVMRYKKAYQNVLSIIIDYFTPRDPGLSFAQTH